MRQLLKNLPILLISLALSCDPVDQAQDRRGGPGSTLAGADASPGSDEPVWINGVNLVGLPDARSIHIDAASDIVAGTPILDQCKSFHPKSPIGFPIFFSCLMAQLGDNILYGPDPDTDKDGRLTCGDYKQGQAPEVIGVIMGLLCDKRAFSEEPIESMRFDTAKNEIAISFANQLPLPSAGIGTWSSLGNDKQRYPADVKIWRRPLASADLKGILAMDLESADLGTLWFDDTKGTISARGQIAYSPATSSEQCLSSPSVEHCYSQDIVLSKFGIGLGAAYAQSLDGMHLRVLADDRALPELVVVEGRLRAGVAGMAEKLTGADSVATRDLYAKATDIYYRFVRKGTNFWSTIEYLDKNGAVIAAVPYDVGGKTVDLAKVARDGVEAGSPYSGNCMDLATGAFVACKDLKYTDYNSLWIGKKDFVAPAGEMTFPFEFGPPPQTIGIQTLKP